MSYTELVLKTKQAKEAMGEGFITLLLTGDFNTAWKAMVTKGNENFSYPALKLALIFDFVRAIKIIR